MNAETLPGGGGMTGWHLGPMAPFDIESGGVDVENDGIVTVTVATVGGNRAPDLWTGLIAVDFDIAPEATAVHGIETAYARHHGKPAADVLDEATERLAAALSAATPVVAMNVPFDLTILDRDCRRHGVPTLTDRLGGAPIAPVIDVLVLDKALDRYRPGRRKLENLAEQYGVKHGGAHDALEDALAAARVAWAIGHRSHLSVEDLRSLYADRKFPDRLARDWQAFSRMSLAEVHVWQVGKYEEQASGLGDYWRRSAEEQRSIAARHDEGSEEHTIALQEAAELDARVDSLNYEWPLQPLREAP